MNVKKNGVGGERQWRWRERLKEKDSMRSRRKEGRQGVGRQCNEWTTHQTE